MSIANEPACYLLVRKYGKLLFVMRSNTGFMDGKYSLPAGHVEAEETYSAGATREAFEEVGLHIEKAKIKHVFTLHRHSDDSHPVWTDVFFEVTDWAGEPVNNEPHKHSSLAWFDDSSLPDSIMDYQLYALTQIAAGESYGEFGWPVAETD